MGGAGSKKREDFREDMMQSSIKAFNIQGKKKKMELTNQDVFDIITTDFPINLKYFAVYDGHGVKGREAAEELKIEVHKRLLTDKSKLSKMKTFPEVEDYFKTMYKKIQKKFASKSEFDLSGTCSVSVLIIDTRMYAINIGDSRCVLGQRKGGEEKKGGEKIGIEMSIDHKPTRDDEMRRIVAKGGEVSEKVPGAPRVFRKNDDVPGLAVARSVGDLVAHEVGVSCEPEVFEKELDADDHFIVIGSDGIWDAMSSCEVVGYIFKKMDESKELCAKMLAEECRNRWEALNIFKQKYILELNVGKENENEFKGSGDDTVIDIDDITCIICFINIEKDEY